MHTLKDQLTYKKQQFLPDFCALNLVFSVVVIGELFAIILSVSVTGFNDQSWTTLAVSSLYIQWNGLLSIAFLCALRKYISGYNKYIIASISYSGLLCLFLLISELTYNLISYMHMQTVISAPNRFAFHFYNVLIGGIISGFVLRYFYIQHQWKLKTELEAQSHLKLLQARIRPHFLFNSMNTIASLTRSNPELAEQVSVNLAELFRVLFQEEQSLVSWTKELQIAKYYLHIESLRFAERLKIKWSVIEVPDNAMLPLLTLQPLLENAIYHGIEPSVKGGEIHIDARINNKQIEINITNSQTTSEKYRKGNQMALDNIRQRLHTYFGDAAGLKIVATKDEFQVSIFFPYKTNILLN
ncbi:MAG: histidine kinase [Methylococcales bacterium]